MTKLRAIVLRDNKPGHYHSSEAVLAAAGRLRGLAITRIEIAERWYSRPIVLTALMNHRIATPAFILRHFFDVEPQHLKPDLIVSSGGDTLAANIALARLTGAPNIFFGSLRRFDARDLTLALNSYSARQPAANQVRILKPSPGDPAELSAPDLDHRRLPKTAGLLVGGPSGEAQFEQKDWEQLISFLIDTQKKFGIHWIVSNSRRTSETVSARFSALAARAGSPVKQFIDVRAAGPGTLGALFAHCGAVAITADSSAMLSEAIWMRRPAVTLSPRSMMLTPNEAEYRCWLAGRNLCRDIALSDITAERFGSALREIIPMTENPQTELATLLAARLPQLFGHIITAR